MNERERTLPRVLGLVYDTVRGCGCATVLCKAFVLLLAYSEIIFYVRRERPGGVERER